MLTWLSHWWYGVEKLNRPLRKFSSLPEPAPIFRVPWIQDQFSPPHRADWVSLFNLCFSFTFLDARNLEWGLSSCPEIKRCWGGGAHIASKILRLEREPSVARRWGIGSDRCRPVHLNFPSAIYLTRTCGDVNFLVLTSVFLWVVSCHH